MDEKILQAAVQYKQLALSLSELDAQGRLGQNIEPEVQSALLAIYYAKKLDERLNKTAELLTENTGEDATFALIDAADAIDAALEDAKYIIEQYSKDEPEFARQIDTVSESSPSEDLFLQLLKLYKSENIISAAYSYASAHSYSTTPEEFIMRHMDIDIDKMLDIQQSLLDSIGNMLGDEQ